MENQVSIFRVGIPDATNVVGSTTKEAAIEYARQRLPDPSRPEINEKAFLGEFIFPESAVQSDGKTGLVAQQLLLIRKVEHGLVVWNIENPDSDSAVTS